MDGPVSDAIDLIEALAASRQVHDCMVRQVYRYAMHRSESEEDEDAIADLQDDFWGDGGVIPNLLVALVSSEAFLTRRLDPDGETP